MTQIWIPFAGVGAILGFLLLGVIALDALPIQRCYECRQFRRRHMNWHTHSGHHVCDHCIDMVLRHGLRRDKKAHEIAAVSARAEKQNERWLSGDPLAMYGEFPPDPLFRPTLLPKEAPEGSPEEVPTPGHGVFRRRDGTAYCPACEDGDREGHDEQTTPRMGTSPDLYQGSGPAGPMGPIVNGYQLTPIGLVNIRNGGVPLASQACAPEPPEPSQTDAPMNFGEAEFLLGELFSVPVSKVGGWASGDAVYQVGGKRLYVGKTRPAAWESWCFTPAELRQAYAWRKMAKK